MHNKLPLVRRPAGLGQSAFITTAMFAYEFAPTNLLHELFPATTCFPTPPPATVVLDLDLGWAFEHNTRWGMETRINKYMNRQLQLLLYQIGDCLHWSSGDRAAYFDYNSRKTFQNIIVRVLISYLSVSPSHVLHSVFYVETQKSNWSSLPRI